MKGKTASNTSFIGIIAYLSKFCIFSFMNDREITHFLKINSAILEFKLSSMEQGSMEISGDVKIRCFSIRK